MIPPDLTREVKISLKTAMGQLGYILGQIDDEGQAENILLQLKAVKALLDKTTLELLDGTYRKAMAEKIASAHQSCPGDCGNEVAIERLRRLFPDIPLEEVPERLKEAEALDERLKK
ncbi:MULTISPECIES: metal-sensing transcriptional repressor [unclassified Flagellimonas]|uniref:Metal-sensing transcriptional repressor n=1 Tax=Flagellimonas sp. MMG031 TaxID=3158549 RepID=A0AAU7N0Q1_9FLAO